MNAEQAEDWNGASGREFIEQRERHERMLGRLRARLLAAAQIKDGENILDIGCGCGDTTIPAARATRSGHVLGADFSRIQVAEARRLAAAAGVANARFEVADAQVHPFPAGAFKLVLSSLGVMFFDDPAAAFANLRKALRPGGRLAFLCWRTRAENPVFTTGLEEAAAVLGLRGPPGPSAAFSLADTSRVGALLSGAGFGGIEFAKADEPMLIGRDVDDVLEYECASPAATEILTGLSLDQAAELTSQVRDRLAAYASPDGVIMPGAAWLVRAQALQSRLTCAAHLFRMLYVRSADDDLKAEAVIRVVAARLFAERGAAAVTIREIAAAAGVSPALVIHHYGSKEGLKEAADRRAAAFFEEMLADLSRIGEAGGAASLAELFATRMEREPETVDYVRRLLLDGGDTADGLFTKLFDVSLAGMRSLVAAGVARPAPDERIRTAFLLCNDLAVVLLRRQLAGVVGIDPLSREGLASWSAAVMDVYADGVFAAPAGEPPAGPTRATEDPLP